MSAHGWRAGREGETHAAARTSSNNTPESFIVGVGASGALLAGAAIVFVTLVGLVSFNVWPTGHALNLGINVELNSPTPAASPSNSVTAPTTPGQLASPAAGSRATTGGGTTGSGNSQGANNKGGNAGKPKGGVTTPPTTTVPPQNNFTGTGDTGSEPSTPGSATKDPAHPIHPVHPDRPHGNVPDDTNGSDDGNTRDDSGDVITGKGPFTRPTPPSSSSNNSDSNSDGSSSSSYSNGHRSSKYRH